jgi:hypothetical protein
MSQVYWDNIRSNIYFYIKTYRRLCNILIFLLGFSFVLTLINIYFYMARPSRHYFATNGVSAPLELVQMDRPNDTAYALLPPDPTEEMIMTDRIIPQ